jgi:hypothetical protein
MPGARRSPTRRLLRARRQLRAELPQFLCALWAWDWDWAWCCRGWRASRRTVATEIDELYDAEAAKNQLGHTSQR